MPTCELQVTNAKKESLTQCSKRVASVSHKGYCVMLVLLMLLALSITIYCVISLMKRRYWVMLFDNNCYNLFTPPQYAGVEPNFVNAEGREASVPMDPEYFKTKRIVICGLLRDKASQIAFLKQTLSRTTDQFHDWALVVVENDSNDNTRELLLEWQQEDPEHVFILGCGLNQAKCQIKTRATNDFNDHGAYRIEKMSKLRNEYLEFVRSHSKLSHFDYMNVRDLDMISYQYLDGWWNAAYIFKHNLDINVIASVGMKRAGGSKWCIIRYQDEYAHWEESSLWRKDNYDYMWLKCLLTSRYPYGSKGQKITSAFNGSAIYRMSALHQTKACYKVVLRQNKDAICEHVPFHRELGGVYLNPNMLNLVIDNTTIPIKSKHNKKVQFPSCTIIEHKK